MGGFPFFDRDPVGDSLGWNRFYGCPLGGWPPSGPFGLLSNEIPFFATYGVGWKEFPSLSRLFLIDSAEDGIGTELTCFGCGLNCMSFPLNSRASGLGPSFSFPSVDKFRWRTASYKLCLYCMFSEFGISLSLSRFIVLLNLVPFYLFELSLSFTSSLWFDFLLLSNCSSFLNDDSCSSKLFGWNILAISEGLGNYAPCALSFD